MKLYKIKKTPIDKKGRGLYANRDIKEGTKIIDYKGKLITKKQTEESDTVSVPQVKTITKVDLKSHAQKSSVDGHSDDKSSCTCGK